MHYVIFKTPISEYYRGLGAAAPLAPASYRPEMTELKLTGNGNEIITYMP